MHTAILFPLTSHRIVEIRRGNTTWILGTRSDPQCCLPLPMTVDYPSREAIAAQCSRHPHLVQMLRREDGSTYYEIDREPDSVEYRW